MSLCASDLVWAGLGACCGRAGWGVGFSRALTPLWTLRWDRATPPSPVSWIGPLPRDAEVPRGARVRSQTQRTHDMRACVWAVARPTAD